MEERYAFVLRIWLQRPAQAHQPQQLRGMLQSNGPGPPRYFSSLAQLTQLLAASLETPAEASWRASDAGSAADGSANP